MANKVTVTKNGPYLVSGKVPLGKEISVVDKEDNPCKWEQGKKFPLKDGYALCRCGQSKSKPYCDGSHVACKFNGTETASNKKYLEQAEKYPGQEIDLTDAESLCSSARFCHAGSGAWDLTKKSANPKAKKQAIEEACNCCSGRLVVWHKKTAIEPKFKPSISVLEDSGAKVSGPLWVKGGIPIESEQGTKYEVRNRVTLCRCGKSTNKPFCDGSHIRAKFKDE